MSFVTKTADDLLAVAEEYAVDIPDEIKSMRNGPKKKQAIIDELSDSGVTWDHYKTTSVEFREQEVENEVQDAQDLPAQPTGKQVTGLDIGARGNDQVLLKMERNNPTYETYGVRFTKEHPFAVVTMDTAVDIMTHESGFRLSQQAEVEQYYN